jgi:hypothetical protein
MECKYPVLGRFAQESARRNIKISDLVGVQEVIWDRGGTEPASEYIFSYGKGVDKHVLGKGFFVHKRIVSAVKRLEFVNVIHNTEMLLV